MVSSRCGADKESTMADGAVVETLPFHRVEDFVSVMFLLASGWSYAFVTHAAAAEQVSILI